MIIIGIDPGLTGAISIRDDDGHYQLHDMPQQIKSVKRKRNKKGEMQDYPSYEVNAAAFGAIIHPSYLPPQPEHSEDKSVKIYIEQVGAVYRSDKQGGKSAFQPLHATFVFGEGFGVIRGLCEAYYGKAAVTRVAPITWKKHFGLLKTEKDAARIYAIENILLEGVAEDLKYKKNGGRADALLIGTYGLNTELEK